jgi:hypothetical protein
MIQNKSDDAKGVPVSERAKTRSREIRKLGHAI